jgi:hypothetical protein
MAIPWHPGVSGLRVTLIPTPGMEPTNPDVLAFHEGFADLCALFSHFSQHDALLDTIQLSGGLLYKNELASVAPLAAESSGKAAGKSASPHESQLVEGVLGHSFLDTLPTRLIGDKAYDSDRLDRELAEHYGIEMIAPHRGERRMPTQDGRPLRRYR